MKKKGKKKVKEYILNGSRRLKMNTIKDMVANFELSRAAIARSMNAGKGEEDVDEECGYPDDIDFKMYKRMFLREGVAKRVVTFAPTESWSVTPWVYETEKVDKKATTPFELDWVRLEKKFNITGKLKRLDIVSRIGRYGVMLIGINDGRSLTRRIDGLGEDGLPRAVRNPIPRDLLYLMPFDEGEAVIDRFQEDKTSPRYGQPLYYNITFNNPQNLSGTKGIQELVHWSRCLHVADNCTSSDIFGMPAQEACYNYILNLRKVLGGGAEMFWKGGFPGLVAQSVPGLEVDMDIPSIEANFEKYMKKLRRYLAVENMEVKSLESNIASPKEHIAAQIMAICIAIEQPQRMFMGSEEARMASIMDSEVNNKRVHGRQNVHCDPNMLRPLVQRFLDMRVLSPLAKPLRGLENRLNLGSEFLTAWPDLYAISGKDKADMTGVLVKALSEYITSGAARIFPPLQFLTMIMDFTTDQAEEIIKAAEVEAKKQDSGKSIAISPVQLAAASAQVRASVQGGQGPQGPGKNGKPLPKSQRTPRAKSQTPKPKSGRNATRPRSNSR